MTTITTCYHCQSPYDALAASWCDCPVGDPTLICPSCTKIALLSSLYRTTSQREEALSRIAIDRILTRPLVADEAGRLIETLLS